MQDAFGQQRGGQDYFGQTRGGQGMNRGRGQQPQINDNFLNQSIQGGFGANARNPSGLNMNDAFGQSQFGRQTQFDDTQFNRRGGFDGTRRGGLENTQFSRMGEFDETQFNRRGTPDIQRGFVANQFQRGANSSGGGRGALNNTNQGGYVQPFALTNLDPRDPKSRTASNFDNNSGYSPDRMLFNAFGGQNYGYENQQQNFQQSRNFGRTGMGYDQSFDQPMYQTDSFESILHQIGSEIQTFNQHYPNKFFTQFDAFLDRQYEYWELMCMFKLTNQQARTLIKEKGDKYGQHVTLKSLCETLRNCGLQGIDYLGFSHKSEYEEKCKQLSATQKQVFLLFAKTLKTPKFSSLSGTYIEAFRSIHKQEGKGADQFSCHVEAFTEFLNRECASSFPNLTDIQSFFSYVQIDTQHMVNACQFVRAMNKIEPDIRFVDDFNEKMGQICSEGLDTSTSFTRLKVLYNNLDKTKLFKDVQELQIKKTGDAQAKVIGQDATLPKVKCGRIAELEDLLDVKLKGNFDSDERTAILNEYSVTPHVTKVAAPPLRNLIAEDLKGRLGGLGDKLNISGSSSNLMPPPNPQPSPSEPKKIPTPELQSNPSRTILPPINEHIEAQEEDKEDDSLSRGVMESQNATESRDVMGFEDKKVPELRVPVVQLDKVDDKEDSYEEYEGGEKEGWFNIDLFTQDMALTPNLNLEQSFPSVIAFDVFEIMKRWYILTGKNVLQTFKSIDPKGHMMVNEKQLKTFFEQVYGSIKDSRHVPEIIVKAMFSLFQRYSDLGGRCVDYSVLYNCYLIYCNKKREPEAQRGDNPNQLELKTIIKAISDVIKQKQTDSRNFSLNQFLGLQTPEFLNRKKKDRSLPLKNRHNQISIMTSKDNFFNKFHISIRKQVLNNTQKQLVFERIKSMNNDIDIVKFIEFIGIDREVEISYTTKLRSVCQALQLKGVDFEFIQSSIPFNATTYRFREDMVKFLTPNGQRISQSMIAVIQKLEMEYKIGQTINSKALMGRIQFEMNKFLYIERFYIKISKEIGHLTLPMYLQQHKADLTTKLMDVEHFKQLLHDLGIADHIVSDDGKISPEMSYFLDEYVAGEEKTIEIKRFEDDYEEIVAGPNSFMEQLVSNFFLNFYDYCQLKKFSIVEAFTEAQKIAGSKVESSQNMWIHQFTFIQWYKLMMQYLSGKQEPEINHDLVNLFVQWMSEGGKGDKKDMIFLPNLYKKYQASVDVGNDHMLEQFQVDDAIKKLKIHILERLSWSNKRPEEHFDRYAAVSESQFMALLSSPPLLYETLGLNVRLETIAHHYKDSQFDRVDLNRFVIELVELSEGQKKLKKVFLQIAKNLELKGQTIQIFFAELHGEIESGTIEVSYKDFLYLFKKYYNDKTESAVKEEDVKLIFNQLQRDQYGEVTIKEFMREFKEAGQRKVTGTTLADAGNQIVQKAVVEAKRFQTDTKSSLIQVATQIVKSNMHTFGTYLKGYDFKSNGLIARQDFYKVFEQIFGEELGAGDILDLIEFFDSSDSGFISTEMVATELNYQIQDLRSDCLVRLTSKVADLVLDRIVEPIDSEKPKLNVLEPRIFQKMLLDLLCSIFVQVKQQEYTYGNPNQHGNTVLVQQVFEKFIDEEEMKKEVGQKQIQKHQFEQALNSLRVIGTQKEKIQVFYFVQHEAGKFRDAPKEDVMEINQMVNWLMNANSKIYFDDRRLQEEILTQIATNCSKLQLPIREIAEKYEKSKGKILTSEFSFCLIEKDFHMIRILTHNMIDFITLKYNTRRDSIIEYEPFLHDLMAIEANKTIKMQDGEEMLTIKLFQTTKEVQNYQKYLKTDHNITVKYVTPLDEPEYSARTNKNTYHSATMIATVKYQSKFELEGIFNDIVRKSRSKGLSVEKYFQNDEFAKFSPEDGIRYLEADGFCLALSKLFDSKNRNEEFKLLFQSICEAFGQTQDFRLTLEQIGSVIFNQSTLSIVDEEAKSIEIVYEAIKEMGLIQGLHKIFDFMNDSRDCTVRPEDFLKFLSDHLGLQNKLPRQSIEFLVWRYRSQKMDLKNEQGKPVYFIYFYKFLEDMQFMKSLIGLKDQAAAKFAEQFIKALQEQKIANTGKGLQDSEVERELYDLINENSAGGYFQFNDFMRVVDQLRLSEVVEYGQLNDFFIYCEQGQFSFQGWRPNNINISAFKTPIKVLASQFVKCVMWLCQKPLMVLYQEILDRVYISSKRRNVFIKGPYVTNIFNSEDLNRSGQIQIKAFANKIHSELLAGREGKMSDALMLKELEFLATKYLNYGRNQVNYQKFFEDYYYIETEGLGTGYNSTNLIPRQEKTKTIMMSLADQSEEIKKAFTVLADHLTKHKKDRELCYLLSNSDSQKNAFIKRETIEQCLVKSAPKIKQMQIDLLIKPLSEDADHNRNYLEMVFMLFGKEILNSHIQSEKIQTQAVPQIIDQNVASNVDLVLSQGLIDEIELKYFMVLDKIGRKAQGETIVRDQEVLVILMMECQIKINSDDLEVLKRYIQQTRDQSTFKVNMLEVLNNFGVTRHSADLLEKINQHLSKNSVEISQLFQKLPQEVNIIDFKSLLQTAKFNGLEDSIVMKDLEKLFRQICKRQSFAPKSLVMSFFALPKEIADFINILQEKEVDLVKLFIGRKTADSFEVPVNLMTSELLRLGFFTAKIITCACEYFSSKPNTVDMIVLLECLQSQQKKKVKPLNLNVQPVQESVEQKMMRALKQYPLQIRLIIQKLVFHMDRNKILIDQVFQALDFNHDGTINPKEFDDYFVKNLLSDDLPKGSVGRLFKFLDTNNDGNLSLDELSLILKTELQTFKGKLENLISKEFDKELRGEVRALFKTIVGNDRDSIRPAEMIRAFKPQDSSYFIDLNTVKNLDTDGDGLISLEEFETFVVMKQKQQILQMENQMEEIKRIFNLHVSTTSGGQNANQLTEKQLKELLIRLGMHEETEAEYSKRLQRQAAGDFNGKRFTTAKTSWLTDEKIKTVFSLIDKNKNGIISINELMGWLYNCEVLESDDAKDLLMNLRKRSFKLNEQSFFQLLIELPETYMASCTQPKLECESKVTPSMSLQPRYDFSERKFKEIEKLRGFKAEQDQQYIRLNRPAHAFEVTIGEIVGIPNLNPGKPWHVEMRIFLFDSQRKIIVSGVHTVNCGVKDGNALSSPWTVQESLKTLYMRTNDTLWLVMEFVHYQETNKNQQVMVAWAKLELGKAIQKQQFGMAKSAKSKHKLELFGGSPFGRTEKPVRTKEDEAIGSSAKDKFLKAFGQKVKVDRSITLEVTEFGNFATQIQKDICAIPENVICYKKLLSFAAQYRSYTYNSLIKDQQQMKRPKADLVLSQFSKIYDSPDIQAVLVDHWQKIIETQQAETAIKEVITQLYVVTFDRKFNYNSIYPTRSTTGKDFETRKKIIEQALGQRVEAAPAVAELVLLEDYQPFNVCEIMSDELLRVHQGL